MEAEFVNWASGLVCSVASGGEVGVGEDLDVALELGELIDRRILGGEKATYSMVHSVGSGFSERTDLHRRVFKREEYLLTSLLHLPSQRVLGEWPFDHLMAGRPTKRTPDPLAFLIDEEAHRQYAVRARECSFAELGARYADAAFLTAPRESRLEFARLAVARYGEDFAARVRVEEEKPSACAAALRAFEIAASVGLQEEVAKVGRMIVEYVLQHLEDPSDRAVSDLVYGLAELDKRRVHLDFVAVAQKLEELAVQGKGRGDVGSNFGFAYGVAKLTKDRARIERVGRQHAESYLKYAKGLRAAESPHAMYWCKEAWSVLQELGACPDLKEGILKELQALSPELEKHLRTFSVRTPISPELRKEFDRLRDKVVSARNGWPLAAAGLLLECAITRQQAEEFGKNMAEKAPLSELFGHALIEDGHTVLTSGDDWRHSVMQQLRIQLLSMLWPHVFAPVLESLHDASLLSMDVLMRPFVEFDEDVLARAESAASAMLRGDFVGAMPGWVLLAERLIRLAVQTHGGSTTVIDQDAEGEHEAQFDRALQELQKRLGNDPGAERFCVLLNALLGWRGIGANWRNRIAHALMAVKEMTLVGTYTAYFVCVLVALVSAEEKV